MNRFCYSVWANICLLMIPLYVFYDGMTTIPTEDTSPTNDLVNGLNRIKFLDTQADVTHRPQTKPSDVIINTYMRAGSSFVGRILGFREDSFYVYEPLWTFHRYGYYRGMKEVCWAFSPGCSKITDLYRALRFLRSIYDCQFYKYSKYFKENIHQKMSGPSWSFYHTCRKNRGIENITTCIRKEGAVCKSAKHRVTKVLRLSLDIMHIFLKERPNIKVIHLFRDPRAMINSHFQTRWSPVGRGGSEERVENAARAICDRMARDIEIGERLSKTFPDRFKIIQYEDFDDPRKKINILYKFLGMDPAEEIEKYISKPNMETRTGTTSGNHPFQYRTTLEWSTVEIIDKYCSHIYDKLGYAKYSDEVSYRNLSISGLQTKLPYGL